ncbi:MAG: hypothetical protein Q9170_004250 [Blastenia crenularia]
MAFGVSRMAQTIVKLPHHLLALLCTDVLTQAYAATAKICTTGADTFIGNSEKRFGIGSWMSRGICVRADSVDALCYSTLEATLENLNNLRSGEYNGAAGVLALLPTIGALLGAPTTEIWRLLTVVPFGGGIAMALSFGSAILPVRVEDYETDWNDDELTLGSIVTLRRKRGKPKENMELETSRKLNRLVEKIRSRMRQDESLRLRKDYLAFGLVGMALLFIVTLTAIADNWAQIPFKETWKLFVSDIPYDVTVSNGDKIKKKLEKPYPSVNEFLSQLSSMRNGTAIFSGSREYARPRNSVLIMVSVIKDSNERIGPYLRLFTKCTSIATFVTGTAFFASVQLLALPVAVMTLTLVLAAGVFSRAITGWIVSGVNQTEPMLHVIVNSTQEAQHVIARILSMDEDSEVQVDDDEARKIQVEIDGHIFVEQRRVARRTPWHIRILGVLSRPYDLRKVDASELYRKVESQESPPSEEV